MGMVTIGFGGRDGGKMKNYCDEILIAPTNSMEQLEDMHMLYEHAIVSLMQKILPLNFDVEVVNYPKVGRRIKAAFFRFRRHRRGVETRVARRCRRFRLR